mgnify:CR=1 FL=1
MKHTIKVNVKNDLTQEQLDTIIEDKNTINLSWIKSTKQILKNKIKTQLFFSLTLLLIILGLNIHFYNSNALEVKYIEELEQILELDQVEQTDIDKLSYALINKLI